jgi:hypothetical protein
MYYVPTRYVLKLSKAEKLTLEQMRLNRQHLDIRTRPTELVLLGNGWTAPNAAARIAMSVRLPDNSE